MIAPYKALRSSTLNAMSLCYLLRTIRRQIPAARLSHYVEFWEKYDTRDTAKLEPFVLGQDEAA